MKILAEANCARKYRRLTSPMTVNIRGKVYSVRNWSPGGMLVKIEEQALRIGRIDDGEMLLTCTDGVFLLPVQIYPLHDTPEGFGCRFVDIPPRERSILHHYADASARGVMPSVQELETAGKSDQPVEEFGSAIIEEGDKTAWYRRLARMSAKRIIVVVGFALVICVILFFVAPYYMANAAQRQQQKVDFLNDAQANLQTEKIALADLNSKIGIVQGLLNGSSTKTPLGTEQERILRMGLAQLQSEQQLITTSIDQLKTDISDTEKNPFFFSRSSFSQLTLETRAANDPAPYISEILRNYAGAGSSAPHNQAEIDKYLLVAESRVEQATYSLQAAKVKRESLEKIVQRVDDAGDAAGFPLNQLDLMKRDIELLKIEEGRLTGLLTLLKDNVVAVKSGNFIYETTLLQRFDSEPGHGADAVSDSNLVK